MEIQKIKVDIKNGVYLDKNACYAVLELGEAELKSGGGRIPAIRVTCNDSSDVETSMLVLMNNEEELTKLALHVHHSEYLGEL